MSGGQLRGPERPGYGAYQVAMPEALSGQTMFDLRTLLSILRRRFLLLVGIVMIAAVCSLLYVSQLTPLYIASTQIIVAPDRTTVLKGGEVVDPLPSDLITLSTEAAKITSFPIVARAVDLLNLEQDPRFNPTLAQPAPSDEGSGIARLTRSILESVGLVEPPAPVDTPTMDAEMVRQVVIGRFMSGASAAPLEKSRIINIAYTHTEASFAGQAANAIALAYIESQSQTYDQATQEALDQVQAKIDEIQPLLTAAQRKLEEFRQANGISGDNEASREQLARQQLDSQLLDAKAELDALKDRLLQVENALNGQGSIETAPDVISNSIVQNLRFEEIALMTEIAQLASKYRDGHPKMIEAKARLAEVRARLVSEISKIKGILQNEVSLAANRVAQIESALAELDAVLALQGGAEVELTTLLAEVEAMQKQYDSMLDRYNQIASQAGINDRPDAEILTQASAPGSPFYPRTTIIVGMAVGVAFVLGIVLAFALEMLDSGFRSLGQIESQTGMPTLGMMPIIELKGKSLPHQVATGRHGTIFAEAVRTVRTSLMLSTPDRPPRVVVVTSSMPNEGKTTTVLSIASQTVQTGRRCIVVDCDMRQASIDDSLGYPDHAGLSDFLVGAADLTQVIGVDEKTGVHFIGAGTQAAPPVELLGSSRMRNLIRALGQSYHLVILDTPPLLAVSDALVLLRDADATVFLIRWEKTPRETAKLGIKAALEVGARVAGVVMTYVDVRKHSRYTYADSGYYHNKAYRKYYYTKPE